MLEQKVWLTTSSPLFPNLYVFLVGHPGTGKTRTIRKVRAFAQEIDDFKLAPVSLTWASLVDAVVRNKRTVVRMPEDPLEYNTMLIAADEIGTLIHKWDKEMADGLSAFYDNDPYGQERRGSDLKIKIKSPQINMLCGSTPSNLLETLPEGAWGQGFTSRTIMVFSDERIIGDDFAEVTRDLPLEMIADLKHINSVVGEFKVTEEYRNVVNLWRQAGETMPGAPAPDHPKLLHYNTRRRVHLYKLSMISAIDRGDVLILDREDFNRAMGWLAEAEAYMSDIFRAAGGANADAQAMEDIYHFIKINDRGQGVSEAQVIKRASALVPAHSVLRLIELMERSGQIKAAFANPRTGLRSFKALRPANPQIADEEQAQSQDLRGSIPLSEAPIAAPGRRTLQ